MERIPIPKYVKLQSDDYTKTYKVEIVLEDRFAIMKDGSLMWIHVNDTHWMEVK